MSFVPHVPSPDAILPEDVSLSAVYDLDLAMGERLGDLVLWDQMTKQVGSVIEVGCGTGRVLWWLRNGMLQHSRPAGQKWIGIDADESMVALFRQRTRSALAVHGHAEDPHTWARVNALLNDKPADVVIVPFSTMYLLPHVHQVEMLQLAAQAVRVGGRVVVECFVPQLEYQRSGRSTQVGSARGPDDEPWVRHSTYDVDAGQQITDVVRLYGPPEQFRYRVKERIHWRHLHEFDQLFVDAGLVVKNVWTDKDRGTGMVPHGSVVVVGERV